MKSTDRTEFVICTDNRSNPASLELRKIYRTLPDHDAEDHGWIRVIDEEEEDYLYPSDMFEPVALNQPAKKVFQRPVAARRSKLRRRSANGKKKTSRRVA